MMSKTAICASCQLEVSMPLPVACPSCHASPALAGRYMLLTRIGQGSFGTTYEAISPDGDIVAIKELLVRSLDTFKTEELFSREAEVLRALSNPGIPRFIEHFTAGVGRQTGFYLVTEFIDGATLKDELLAHRPTEAEVVEILKELAEILAYLHERRPAVVHRDIKPTNIMRHRDGRLILIDFGAVKAVTEADEGGGSTVAGTFGYMAPEQFAGIADPASDVYALGVVAVELLTGRTPQSLTDDQNRFAWQAALGGVSAHLRAVLTRALAPNRKDRPQDGRAFAALLAQPQVDPAPSASFFTHSSQGFQAFQTASQIPGMSSAKASVLNNALDLFRQSGLRGAAASFLGLGVLGDVHERPLGPPPDAKPRALPSRFVKRTTVAARTIRILGFVFMGVGAVMAAGGVAAMKALIMNADGPPNPMMFFGFGAVFALPGALMAGISHRKIRRLAKIWRHGDTTVATVTDISRDGSVSVNGRYPFAISLSFVVEGRTYEARSSRWSRDGLNVGSQTYILYQPANPERCLIYPLPPR